MRLFLKVILVLVLTNVFSCVRKKKPILKKHIESSIKQDYLYLHAGIPFGVLRVECSDCKLIYKVNNQDSTIDVKDGNQDRFIYPNANSYVKTVIQSNKDQMIRLLIVNPNGKIVSNVLDSFSREEKSKKKFMIKWRKDPHTILVTKKL